MPNKGRLKEPAFKLLEEVGIKPSNGNERKLLVPTSDPGVRILMARCMDIPLMVERRAADLGIAGQDIIAERRSKVRELLKLDFGSCTVALAAPEGIEKPKSIATALPNVTADFCKRKGLDAEIIELSGALESVPELGIAEAIVDQVVTGDTLAENRLRILDSIMQSSVYLIGNYQSLEMNEEECYRVELCVKAVLEARNRLFLEVNAETAEIRDALIELLPAMKRPNLSDLTDGGYVVGAAVPRKGLMDLIVNLKAAGGTDIIVGPLKMVIP